MINSAGQSFYDRGNYAQAAMEFQRAVATDPYNADFASNLAAAYKKQGNIFAAEQAWQQALNINPGHQPSYHGLAQMMLENNRAQEASALLTSWSQSQPYSAEPYIEMAWLNREVGNSQGAAQNLQQALSVSPNHAKALASMGQFYQDTGQMVQAASMYQQSLRNDWYQPEVQSRLATLKGFEGEDPTMGMGTQMAFAGQGTNARMPFPPTPQIAQRNSMPTMNPQMAAFQQQNQMAFSNPSAPHMHTVSAPMIGNPNAMAMMAQQPFAANPAVANQMPMNQPQVAYSPPQMPVPQMAQAPVPDAAFAGSAMQQPQPVMQQPVVQQPVMQQPVMQPQPAVTQYPVASGPYTVEDPFAEHFNQQTTVDGSFSTGVVMPQGSVPMPPVANGQIPGMTPNSAVVPQVSAVPEVQPF
jgi:thioredoxin-like negative regulator of GroEL